jgi:hypothetical protein
MPKNIGKGSGSGGGGGTAPPKSAAATGGAVSPSNPAPPTPAGVVQALESSPGIRDNFVNMADLRERLGGTRAEQDAAIIRSVRDGKITMERSENLTRPITAREKAAALYVQPRPDGNYRGPDGRQYTERLVYVSRR